MSRAEMSDEAYLKILQAMSPAQKLKTAERLYWSLRQLKAAALRMHHPDWSGEKIQRAVREAFLNLDRQIATRGLLQVWEEAQENN